ncbi:hypothetical protein ACFOLC_08075 [Lysobacter cavernae]|uniref:Uncharacterized protein n=1 Tax=Lysobacter cavernae TaxID=1685901 RepID=A0ABV7RNP6_9GAMM
MTGALRRSIPSAIGALCSQRTALFQTFKGTSMLGAWCQAITSKVFARPAGSARPEVSTW